MNDSDEVKKLKEKVDSLEELAKKNDEREEIRFKGDVSGARIALLFFVGLGVWLYFSWE